MLTAFTAGLLLISISELGDKTFFISLCLAMRYPRRWVFLGAIAALGTMTVLSVLLGQAVALLPAHFTKIGTVVLFLLFGLKLLYDASEMKPQGISCDAEQEALADIESATADLQASQVWSIIGKTFVMTFLGEWGDRTQFATITLAAAQNPVGVTLGAILGHAICALIAVFCGKLVAGRLSERLVTAIGGGLFLIFGLVTAMGH
jgi:Ca2+/H+ antiporter, TMEM165/GDT1 family